jgi:hypothetical protein
MIRRAAALLALSALAGCAIAPIPPAPASVAVVDKLAASGLPSLAVGSFVAGPGLGQADRGLAVRASTIRPEGGSFAAYLGATVATQLRAAGKLDPAAPLILSGVLVENRVSSAVGTGHARIAAAFTLTRNGKAIFTKTLAAERQWDSSFIGAAAIPAADIAYAGLYTTLVETLAGDPDFRAAVSR